MADYSLLSEFDRDFDPGAAGNFRANIGSLPDGEYAFTILGAEFKTPFKDGVRHKIVSMLLHCDQTKQILDFPNFVNSQSNADYVGKMLGTLGFDSENWKPAQGRSFRSEVSKILETKALTGRRFAGTKRTTPDKFVANKSYPNLYVNSRIMPDATPEQVAALTPAPSAAAGPPVDQGEIPF
jgi:hypothetical protein